MIENLSAPIEVLVGQLPLLLPLSALRVFGDGSKVHRGLLV